MRGNLVAVTTTSETDPTDDYEQSTDSTDDRWTAYKTACRRSDTTPLSWGEWLRAGQPVPVEDDR